jgi:hypothetical protein
MKEQSHIPAIAGTDEALKQICKSLRRLRFGSLRIIVPDVSTVRKSASRALHQPEAK